MTIRHDPESSEIRQFNVHVEELAAQVPDLTQAGTEPFDDFQVPDKNEFGRDLSNDTKEQIRRTHRLGALARERDPGPTQLALGLTVSSLSEVQVTMHPSPELNFTEVAGHKWNPFKHINEAGVRVQLNGREFFVPYQQGAEGDALFEHMMANAKQRLSEGFGRPIKHRKTK